MEPLQIILILVVVAVVLAVMFFLLRQDGGGKKQQMDIIQGNVQSVQDAQASESDQQNKRRAEIAKKLKQTQKEEAMLSASSGKKATITNLLEQAGLGISVSQFWLFSVLSMIVFIVLALIMGMSVFVVIMAGVIGLFGAPRFVLKRKTVKRQKKFLEEFPDALEATVRLLKAGMPVSEAILMISREYEGPVGEEMSRIYDKQKIGVSLPDAALEATRRMPLPEMKMFATGLAIQAQTGSSLSEVLMNLSSVIRARFRLKRKVKALSSEAIASASIIASLPVLVALGMFFTNREYIMLLFEEPVGKIMLAGAAVWMLMGVLVMRTMINFKI